jgi:hypothetical protein
VDQSSFCGDPRAHGDGPAVSVVENWRTLEDQTKWLPLSWDHPEEITNDIRPEKATTATSSLLSRRPTTFKVSRRRHFRKHNHNSGASCVRSMPKKLQIAE